MSVYAVVIEVSPEGKITQSEELMDLNVSDVVGYCCLCGEKIKVEDGTNYYYQNNNYYHDDGFCPPCEECGGMGCDACTD